MAEEQWKFKPSVHYQKEILEDEVRNAPLKCFEKWNICEVRWACLERLGKEKFSDEYSAEWAEYFIKALSGSDVYNDGRLSDKLLELYIFRSEADLLAARAIEFAIQFDKKVSTVKTDLVSKLVAGRLKDDPQLYSEIPSLKKFLHGLLDPMLERAKWTSHEYTNSDWFLVERAQNIITMARNRSFLPKIRKLIRMLEEKVIIPSKFLPEEALTMHLARLRFTKRKLEESKKNI